MLRKVMLLGAAIAAFAAFGASVAQATPVVTDSEEGAAGTITAQSTNTVTTVTGVAGFAIECSTVNLHVNLTQNDTTTAHGSGTGSATGTKGANHNGHCALTNGAPIHHELFTLKTVDLKSDGTGSMMFGFTWTITTMAGPIMCNNTGSATLGYTKGTDKLSMAGTMVGTQNVPPCVPHSTLHGNFTVRDALGEPAQLGHS